MENNTQQGMKKPCCCTGVIGAAVIVLAWWRPTWGPVALTVLGAMIILKEVISKCCCASICKPKEK